MIMNNKIILLMLLCLCGSQAFSQEYSVPKNSGRLILNLRQVIVTGYEGEELVLINKTLETSADERAKGLKPLGLYELEDNTGMGLHLVRDDKNDLITIDILDKDNRDVYEIKVPNGFSSVFINNGMLSIFDWEDWKVTVKLLKCSLEIAGQKHVLLEDNTGPINVSTFSGNIEAKFGSVIQGPISLITSSGYIDVTVPVAIKADIDLATNKGNLFAAEELNLVLDQDARNRQDTMLKRVIGKINHGGFHLHLRSTNGNIYLRSDTQL